MTASVHQSVSGGVLSGGRWLDGHFEAARAEYEAMFACVPLPSNGVLLDAGCGSGVFLPHLAKIAGSDGRVIALDVSPEHLAALSSTAWLLSGAVQLLPLKSGCIDAIWCANVTQFFDDKGLDALLAEFRRVLSPGGILGIKDSDMTGWRIEPAPPFLGLHLAEACAGPDGSDQSFGSIRGRRLRSVLEAAGFEEVVQSSHVIERWSPLSESGLEFWANWLIYLAGEARKRTLPLADAAFWRSIEDIDQALKFVSLPQFYGCEIQVVAYGRSPGVRP